MRRIPPLGGEHPGERGAAALPAVCHCLLLETEADGLVLVDSGLGTADRHDPEGRLGAEWAAYAQPARDPEESALRQIVRLGLDPRDVRHLVPPTCTATTPADCPTSRARGSTCTPPSTGPSPAPPTRTTGTAWTASCRRTGRTARC
ncbi:hypothetical protein ACF07Z_27885 [Streptomyces albidoflavus]